MNITALWAEQPKRPVGNPETGARLRLEAADSRELTPQQWAERICWRAAGVLIQPLVSPLQRELSRSNRTFRNDAYTDTARVGLLYWRSLPAPVPERFADAFLVPLSVKTLCIEAPRKRTWQMEPPRTNLCLTTLHAGGRVAIQLAPDSLAVQSASNLLGIEAAVDALALVTANHVAAVLAGQKD
jgi:hypothetical protein